MSNYVDPSLENTQSVKPENKGKLVGEGKIAIPHAIIFERAKPQKLRHASVNDAEAKKRHGKLYQRSKTLACAIIAQNEHESDVIRASLWWNNTKNKGSIQPPPEQKNSTV